MSIQITKSILNRLIDGKCLTPIEDDPDIWTKVEFGENDTIQHFQCNRMSSLFKDVAEDGTVTYSDVNRVQLINKESPDIPFRNGFGTRLIDKMYPITLPYFPADKKFKIIVEEFLTDEKNGDFDTVGYLQLILPNGEVVDLNGYFGMTDAVQVLQYSAKVAAGWNLNWTTVQKNLADVDLNRFP